MSRFCGTGPAPVNRTSTLGEERTSNPALTASDEASFVRQQVSGLREYPTYYAYMAPINRAGPRLVREVPKPRPLKPSEFSELMAAGTWTVDGRDRWSFARKHILGSINVELDESFASYVGWVVPFGAPIVLVLPEPLADSLDEARTQLLRIGYERVDGYLDELCGAFRSGSPPAVLDVRQQDEWDSGHIPGSTHLFVGDLPRRLDAVPSTGEVWAVCSGGHRSAIAASLLEGAGVPVGLVAEGGVDDWLARCR